MRRLDESLTRLAERGQPVGADTLIERVGHRLALGEDPVVVALDSRRTDLQTQQETDTPQTRRGLWIAAAAFAVGVAVIAGGLLLSQEDERTSLVAGQPAGPLEKMVLALNAGDVETINALVPQPTAFPLWLIGLDASGIEFTDCVMSDAGRIACSVSMGEDWFYSRIAGYPLETTFSAAVGNGRVRGPVFPPPEGLTAAEAEFEAWVLETHPARYDEMFTDLSVTQHIKFGLESGQARSELLEEFLASR